MALTSIASPPNLTSIPYFYPSSPKGEGASGNTRKHFSHIRKKIQLLEECGRLSSRRTMFLSAEH